MNNNEFSIYLILFEIKFKRSKMENENLDDRDSKETKYTKDSLTFKFKPVLRRTKYSQKDSYEFLKFKKTIIHKPFVRKEAKTKKKILVIKPFERNHLVAVNGPVLGKKSAGEKRSVSVAPAKKEIHNTFVRYDDLTLPILSIRHKKYKSREA